MTTKWYVEHYNHYDEAGGVNDWSPPFDTEAKARKFAESLSDNEITLLKVESIEIVDIYHAQETSRYPVGWEHSHTETQLAVHIAAYAAKEAERAQERAREHDEMLRDMARAQAGHPDAPLYARAGTTGYLDEEDVAKIAAYRAEYEAEMEAQA